MMIRFSALRLLLVTAFVACVTFAAPRPAHADGFITPFIGVNFGGATDTEFGTAVGDNSDLTYGVSIGWMGAGIIGVEEDLGYAPKFFAPAALIGQTNVLTLMTNVIIGIPVGGQSGGGVRPYVSGGIGLLRTSVEKSVTALTLDRNSAGWDLGGGINGYFGDHIGVRGDFRYFRDFSISDTDSAIGVVLGKGTLDFYRASIGVVFRF